MFPVIDATYPHLAVRDVPGDWRGLGALWGAWDPRGGSKGCGASMLLDLPVNQKKPQTQIFVCSRLTFFNSQRLFLCVEQSRIKCVCRSNLRCELQISNSGLKSTCTWTNSFAIGTWRRKSHLQENFAENGGYGGKGGEYVYFHWSSLGIHRISSTFCPKISLPQDHKPNHKCYISEKVPI